MGNNRSPESQHNVWRHHILQCSKAGESGLISNIRYYASSAYLQVLNESELKWQKKNLGKLYFRPSRAAYSIVSGWIRSKYKLILAFMHILVTYKNEEDQIKNERARVATTVLHCKSFVIIPDAQGQLTPQSQLRARGNSNSSELLWLSSLVITCKNEEDQNQK